MDRERAAQSFYPIMLSCIEEHAAPPATNIYQCLPLLKLELPADMFILLLLCVFEGIVLILKVGAGIGHALIKEKLIKIVPQVIVMGNIPGRSLKGIERCKMVDKDCRFCLERKIQALKVGIHTKVGQLLKITLYVDFAGNIFLRKTHGTFSENFLDGFLSFDNDEKGGITATELFNFAVPIPNFERNFGLVSIQCPE
jgi:hypothetical protein